ncbi:MAG: hypothetical protein EAX96_08255 [Candidatus Lokiarchaeota archaeon]|nr:hypothetical protein [Candidatus Lokiarchaeota archaeon]
MSAGRDLSILSGVLVLIATFLFSWFIVTDGANTYYAWGVSLVMNIPNLFLNAETLAATYGIHVIGIYLLAVLFILLIISSIFLFVGASFSGSTVIGIIAPLTLVVLVLLGSLGAVPQMFNYLFASWNGIIIIPGLLPLHFNLGIMSIGMWIMLAGGIIGIVSVAFGREKND